MEALTETQARKILASGASVALRYENDGGIVGWNYMRLVWRDGRLSSAVNGSIFDDMIDSKRAAGATIVAY